jgi:hypothetical protein
MRQCQIGAFRWWMKTAIISEAFDVCVQALFLDESTPGTIGNKQIARYGANLKPPFRTVTESYDGSRICESGMQLI